MLKMEIGACLQKRKKKKKKKKKKIKFHIFRFCPTFDMSYLNVYSHQKCKKKKKRLRCNLFWVKVKSR